VANVTQTCWLITAGRSHMRHQQKNTRDKRWQNEFLIIYLFIEYVVKRLSFTLFELYVSNLKNVLIFFSLKM
jgi:hypothetical protein